MADTWKEIRILWVWGHSRGHSRLRRKLHMIATIMIIIGVMIHIVPNPNASQIIRLPTYSWDGC